MTAKEYLQQYKEMTRVIERVRSEYEEEMEQIDNIRSALGGDGLPRSGEVSKKVAEEVMKSATMRIFKKEEDGRFTEVDKIVDEPVEETAE